MFGRRAKPATAATTPRLARVPVRGTMLSHSGCVRIENEDVVAYVLAGEGAAACCDLLALVADGMGGHAAGQVASRIAADTVLRLYDVEKGNPPQRLSACLHAANRAIYRRAQRDPECAGMGTTCTVLVIYDGAAFLGHIGDSRAYLWREQALRQISEDHSLVAQLVHEGSLSEAEAACSPDRHVILRALGIEPKCEPMVWREGLAVRPGDVWVLCSDGLSDLVDAAAICTTIERMGPIEACQALIDMALAAGGTDNVSAGVFAIGNACRETIADWHRQDDQRTTRPLPMSGPEL